jgi:Helix-turn-helix domain
MRHCEITGRLIEWGGRVAARCLLCFEEREEISRGIVAEESGRAIAQRFGRHFSVINGEIARHGGRSAYRACDVPPRVIMSLTTSSSQVTKHLFPFHNSCRTTNSGFGSERYSD